MLQYYFCLIYWFFDHEAYEILASRSGIEPIPATLEGKVLATGLPGKSLYLVFVCLFVFFNFLMRKNRWIVYYTDHKWTSPWIVTKQAPLCIQHPAQETEHYQCPRNPLSCLLSKIFFISISVILTFFNIMTLFSALTALPSAICTSWTFHVMVLRRRHWVSLLGPCICHKKHSLFWLPIRGSVLFPDLGAAFIQVL